MKKMKGRQFVIRAKMDRGECVDCHEIVTLENPHCFDFDHREPADKKFAISTRVGDCSLDKLQIEIDKCDLVCANCHRQRTQRQFRGGILTGTRIIRTQTHLTLFDI